MTYQDRKRRELNEMPKRKLSPDQVLQIKQMLLDRVSHKDIAERFGVSGVTITYIKQGRLWKDCNLKGHKRIIRTCRHCRGRGMIEMPVPPGMLKPKPPALVLVPSVPAPIQILPPPPPPQPKPKKVKLRETDRLLKALRQHHQPSEQPRPGVFTPIPRKIAVND